MTASKNKEFMKLDKQQMKKLRALCHELKPVVRIGQHGFSEAVQNELNLALDHHELVKIKIAADDRDARHSLLEHIAKKTDAVLVQKIGSTATLFKRNEESPVIPL